MRHILKCPGNPLEPKLLSNIRNSIVAQRKLRYGENSSDNNGQSAAKLQTSNVVECSSTTRRRWVKYIWLKI